MRNTLIYHGYIDRSFTVNTKSKKITKRHMTSLYLSIYFHCKCASLKIILKLENRKKKL